MTMVALQEKKSFETTSLLKSSWDNGKGCQCWIIEFSFSIKTQHNIRHPTTSHLLINGLQISTINHKTGYKNKHIKEIVKKYWTIDQSN